MIKKIIRNLFDPGGSLSQKAIRSGFWVILYKIIERGLRFAKMLVIARLLAPSDFGLFGIALILLDMLQTFTETGTRQALIQRSGPIEPYLNTAWTIQFLRGLALAIIVYFIAPFTAQFFKNPESGPVTKTIALNFLFLGLTNIGVVYFEKDLLFGKQRLWNFSQFFTEFSVSIILAVILKNAWALVWGMVAGSFVSCLASYLFHPYRPRLEFNKKIASELMRFGKWIFASAPLIYLLTRLDSILIGRLLGSAALGFYALAHTISNLTATEVTNVISQIAFPLYSKLQNNIPKLKETYLRILHVVALINFPMTVFILFLAQDFTLLFLGEKWLPIIPAIRILVLGGLMRSMGASIGPIYQGIGRTKTMAKFMLFQLVIVSTIIYPLTKTYGIIGTAISVAFPGFLVNIIASAKIAYLLKIKSAQYYNILFFPLVGSILLAAVLWFLKNFIFVSYFSLLYFTLAVLLGSLLYIAAGIFLNKEQNNYIFRLLKLSIS